MRRLAYYPINCDGAMRQRVERFRLILGEKGAVQHLLDATERFSADATMAAGACCALGNLVIDPTNCTKFVHSEGVRMVLNMMRTHESDRHAIDFGCFVLTNVGDDADYKIVLFREGAIEFVLERLARTAPLEDYLPPLDLLTSVVQLSEARVLFPAVLDRLRLFLTSMETFASQKLALSILTALAIVCETGDFPNDVEEANALSEAVRHVLTLSIGKDEQSAFLHLKALLALFSIVWGREGDSMARHRIQLIDSVADGMRRWPNVIGFQRTSAAVLTDLAALDPELRVHVIAVGGKALVDAAKALQAPDNAEDDPEEIEWRAFLHMIHID